MISLETINTVAGQYAPETLLLIATAAVGAQVYELQKDALISRPVLIAAGALITALWGVGAWLVGGIELLTPQTPASATTTFAALLFALPLSVALTTWLIRARVVSAATGVSLIISQEVVLTVILVAFLPHGMYSLL